MCESCIVTSCITIPRPPQKLLYNTSLNSKCQQILQYQQSE